MHLHTGLDVHLRTVAQAQIVQNFGFVGVRGEFGSVFDQGGQTPGLATADPSDEAGVLCVDCSVSRVLVHAHGFDLDLTRLQRQLVIHCIGCACRQQTHIHVAGVVASRILGLACADDDAAIGSVTLAVSLDRGLAQKHLAACGGQEDVPSVGARTRGLGQHLRTGLQGQVTLGLQLHHTTLQGRGVDFGLPAQSDFAAVRRQGHHGSLDGRVEAEVIGAHAHIHGAVRIAAGVAADVHQLVQTTLRDPGIGQRCGLCTVTEQQFAGIDIQIAALATAGFQIDGRFLTHHHGIRRLQRDGASVWRIARHPLRNRGCGS